MHGTFTLTGHHTSITGVPRSGYVVITPNTVIRDTEDKIVMGGSITALLDSEGKWSATLPCDGPTLNPSSGIGYTIAYVIGVAYKRQSFYAPESLTGGTLDVVDIVSVTVPTPMTVIVGKDGKDGVNGKDGVDGKDGADGQPGPLDPNLLTRAQAVEFVNRQAYAGGAYNLGGWGYPPDFTLVNEKPALSYGSDVQGLASGNWDLTGKGGFYRLSVTPNFYANTAPGSTTTIGVQLQLKTAAGVNLYSNTFGTDPGTQYLYGTEKDTYIQVPDDAGVVQWLYGYYQNGVEPVPNGTISVSIDMNFERIAGWPEVL